MVDEVTLGCWVGLAGCGTPTPVTVAVGADCWTVGRISTPDDEILEKDLSKYIYIVHVQHNSEQTRVGNSINGSHQPSYQDVL